ncbi:hypothetical protein JVU11DRAFT_9664 [Chiua virens]|nr:hypothetical protein JVU11DRAFT_12828 [Chiua virens]KAG9310517.1 hypothetical protein JVU11DRAFT_9664 [Chiua virens]
MIQTEALQVHFNVSRARNSFVATGRGGSGNLRRPSLAPISTDDTPTSDRTRPGSEFRPTSPPAEVPPERQSPSEKKRGFTSSGRGGSGNIQPSTSDLEAHPLTASILSRHSAVQAEYEQRIRKAHAESHMVRSSGRGGSGNISDLRRRSRSHEPRFTAKRKFFTVKGRERGNTDGAAQHGRDRNTNRRMSLATCSSQSSGVFEARHSGDSVRGSHDYSSAMTSSDHAIHRSRTKKNLLARRGRLPPPPRPPPSPMLPLGPPIPRPFKSPPTIVPMYPQGCHPGSPGSGSGTYSTMSESAILEDIEEYLSFLDLDL